MNQTHATELAAPAEPHPPPPAPEPPPVEGGSGWGAVARRFGFRVLFVYLTLFFLPAIIQALPRGGALTELCKGYWSAVVAWAGKNVFRLPGEIALFPTGSGDTLYGYATALTDGLLAVAVAAIWTALDRRSDQRPFKAWILAFSRYGLGVTLFIYGLAKLYGMQFAFVTDRLIQPFGEFSPMGVLWTFMGYSPAYSSFTGAAELLGGVLLFFRRTTTLGALVLVAVLSNVLVLNLCYDVPVKLYSAHLLAVALFLAGQDVRRLLAVFVLNRAAPPAPEEPPFRSRRLSLAVAGAGWLLGAVALAGHSWSMLEARAELAKQEEGSPLAGVYLAESIRPAAGAPGTSPLSRAPWLKAAGDGRRWGVLFSDGSFRRFRAKYIGDQAKVTLTLIGTKEEVTLAFERPDPEHVILKNEEVEVRLTRADSSAFPLLSRGFHWVTDYPFNR